MQCLVTYEHEGRCLEVWSGHVRGGVGQVMGGVMGVVLACGGVASHRAPIGNGSSMLKGSR